MNLRFVRPALTTAAVFAAAAIRGPALGAQMPMQHGNPTPAIVTSAMEEVEVAPDRAMLSLAVETRAASAAEAGRLNARIQTAVIDTLKKLGIPAAQLRTQGLSIAAQEYDYSKEVGRQFIGYAARNAIQIEVRDIAMVGTLVDAGLAKGATNVGGVRFFASNISAARREALKKAVERVRADATLMAEAAGGTLGLIELTHSPSFEGAVAYDAPVAMAMKSSGQERTPIEAGMLKVSVSVSARFSFLGK